MARYALVEGAEQLKRALDQIATLPTTPVLRREEIKLEVAFANALALTGDLVGGKEHYDRALAIYDPAEHGAVTTRSGRDVGVTLLSFRSGCMRLLGCPAASRSDGELEKFFFFFKKKKKKKKKKKNGNYAAANAPLDELIGLADERVAPYWKALESRCGVGLLP